MTVDVPFDQEQMAFWRTPPGVRRAYRDARFGQIHYRIARPADAGRVPLLCFHLSPNSGRVYARWLAEMGHDRVAVAPDTPGFGESDAPATAPTIADYAAAMGDLLDHLGFAQVDLMGYHTGSLTSLELAQQRPEQIRRVVLVSLPLYTPTELEVRYRSVGTPAAAAIAADGSHLQRAWDLFLGGKDKRAPIVFVQREVAESLRGGKTAWWGHHAAFTYPLRDSLPRVKQPLLLLCPGDDLWTVTHRAEGLLANGRLHELPDCAHGMLDVHTAAIAAVVRSFLDGPAPNAGATARRPPPATPPKIAHPVRRAFMDGPYGQLHYRIAAPDKPRRVPLVCFHLSPDSGRIYEAILANMGRDRLAVAPDTPGFGESDAPPAQIEIEDYARTMASLIDHLGLEQVDVMGYHTGSETCVELALQRPELVRRIVQISCPVWTTDELVQARARYRRPPIAADGSHLVERWRTMRPYYRADVPEEVFAIHLAESQRAGPALHWGHRAAFNYDLRPKLPLVTQPVLVVSPNDELQEQSRRGLSLMRNGRLHPIAHWGHGFVDTMTEEFGAILRGFLDAQTI
ncbi:MAG: alpha/beta hydrolase [Alphaproteobacteria bacterium]|nr:alpha/beta hydrolase [Alphaproteobacteria bacterium]